MSFSMKAVNRDVPIKDVIKLLGMKPRGNSLRCWRSGHAHGDDNPSVHIMTLANRVRCYKCDPPHGLSSIDLVMSVKGCVALQASNWIGTNFGLSPVQTSGKRNRRNHRAEYNRQVCSAVQRLGANPARLLTRLAFDSKWPHLRPPDAKLYVTLLTFALAELGKGGYPEIILTDSELVKLSGLPRRSLIRAKKRLDGGLLTIVSASVANRKIGEGSTYRLPVLSNLIEIKERKPRKR
jgi:hypothetical protein